MISADQISFLKFGMINAKQILNKIYPYEKINHNDGSFDDAIFVELS